MLIIVEDLGLYIDGHDDQCLVCFNNFSDLFGANLSTQLVTHRLEYPAVIGMLMENLSSNRNKIVT